MAPLDLSDLSVIDLSDRPHVWKPHVDAFGKPAESALYVALVDVASMRLSRGDDGEPKVAIVEGDSVCLFALPSKELVEFLDRWQLRRHRRLLSEAVIAAFFRLVRARVTDPEFEDDPPFLGPKEEWNERRTVPLPGPSDVERLIDHLDRLCARSEGFVARLDDLAVALSLSADRVREVLVDRANTVQIREAGFRLRAFPSAFGTAYVVERLEVNGKPGDPRPG